VIISSPGWLSLRCGGLDENEEYIVIVTAAGAVIR
jgi:hypothetical protein